MVDWIPQSRAPGAVISDPPGYGPGNNFKKSAPPSNDNHGSSQTTTEGAWPAWSNEELKQEYAKHQMIFGQKWIKQNEMDIIPSYPVS